MKRNSLLGGFLLLLMAVDLNAQPIAQTADVTVEISGLRNYRGQVLIALWADVEEKRYFPDATKVRLRDEDDAANLCDFPKAALCRRAITGLQNLTVSLVFRGVPAGDYAVFAFHDENANGLFDRGLLRRPLEARGYSQVLPEEIRALATRVPYHRARFTVSENRFIAIGLRYPPRL